MYLKQILKSLKLFAMSVQLKNQDSTSNGVGGGVGREKETTETGTIKNVTNILYAQIRSTQILLT